MWFDTDRSRNHVASKKRTCVISINKSGNNVFHQSVSNRDLSFTLHTARLCEHAGLSGRSGSPRWAVGGVQPVARSSSSNSSLWLLPTVPLPPAIFHTDRKCPQKMAAGPVAASATFTDEHIVFFLRLFHGNSQMT